MGLLFATECTKMKDATNGLLLINIGSPVSPDVPAVRRYLREFLSDKRIIDLPLPLRLILLYGFILPFRPKRSAHAYQAIWTEEGAPLITHSQALAHAVQEKLGAKYKVVVGMRYGAPSISSALDQLKNCEHITVLPLYPQYSSAATGSSIEEVLQTLAPKAIFPSLTIIRDFYKHPAFLHAQAEQIKPYVKHHDYLLFSYHGLPENQLKKGGCKPVCVTACPPLSATNQGCYRAQCLQTSAQLAKMLGLTAYGTSFQSRLGRTPWIKPYTDLVLPELANAGIKRLAVACPSFVADCLETLEEIGMQAKEQWHQLGGEELTLIPCMNANELWVDAVVTIVSR